MKKIIFYIDSMGRGGAQRVMNNLITEFSKENDVVLINDVFLEQSNEYDICDSIKRINLGVSNGGIFGNLKRVSGLRRIIRKEKAEIVISFLGPCNIRMLLATIGLRIEKYVSVRNDPYFEYGGGIKKFLAGQLFKLSSGCVFQTKEAQQYFPETVRKKSKIIWNPVAEKFYKEIWCPQREEIAVVGRLQKQKKPLLALNVFMIVHNEYPDIKLVYYGDGELRTEIEAMVKKYELNEVVSIKGNVENIEDYLSTARLFLMTSSFEGMPNALMEAMTVGIPSVATDCPCGGPRAVTNGFEDFVLVPCNNDAVSIAQKVIDILNSKDKQVLISLKERDRAQQFRSASIMQQWKEFMWK